MLTHCLWGSHVSPQLPAGRRTPALSTGGPFTGARKGKRGWFCVSIRG